MKNLILLALLSTSILSFAQTKLTIQSPDEKVAIVSTLVRDFTWGDRGFEATRENSGKNGAFVTTRGFLQFDLSSIPQGSFVNWARLTLFTEGAGGPGDFLIRRVTSSWDPAKVTWNTQPSTALRATIRLPLSIAENNLKNLNVTNLVQNMVDSPATSFGFALRVDSDAQGNTNKGVIFSSPSFHRPHDNPKLVMEYTAPGMQKKTTAFSLGIDGEQTQMNIYPNPCRGSFYVDVQSTQQKVLNLKVVDMLGRAVYSQNVEASSMHNGISLPSSLTGIYFVVLQSNSGTILSQEIQVN